MQQLFAKLLQFIASLYLLNSKNASSSNVHFQVADKKLHDSLAWMHYESKQLSGVVLKHKENKGSKRLFLFGHSH